MENLEISEIFNAAAVLKDVARRTAIIPAPQLCPGLDIYLKTENLQLTGSFKLRGAYYKISQLTDEEKSRGVIACSAGNHAQGVALGATHNGIKSLICLPAGAPISKVEATKGYGAEVCLVPGVYDDAYAKAMELQKEHGYTFVHPFDDPKVIAGQGTIGLEILEQMPDVQAVVVPIGGGGLISGVAFAIKTLRPDVKVFGVQSSGAPSMAASLKEGKLCHLNDVSTIADGIAVKEPGVNTFEMCNRYVDEVVTVSDDEIAAAILALIEKQKIVAEGGGDVRQPADRRPQDGMPCIGRQYRREHIEPSHHPRLEQERAQLYVYRRPRRQTRPALGRMQCNRRTRRKHHLGDTRAYQHIVGHQRLHNTHRTRDTRQRTYQPNT